MAAALPMDEELIFYHFTRGVTVAMMMTLPDTGLTKGDVPITMSSGFNAVWLTTDPDPRNFRHVNTPGIEKQKKEARITIRLSNTDPCLR